MAAAPETGIKTRLLTSIRSTKVQLVVIMLFLVIITGVIVTATSLMYARASLEDKVSGVMAINAANTADSFNVIFIAATDEAGILARDPRIVDLLETEQENGPDPVKRQGVYPALDAADVRTSDMISTVQVVNTSGFVIASSHREDVGESRSADPVFRHGLSGAYIGDPALRGNEPFISYAVPVTGKGNETLGVVIIGGPLKFIETIGLQPVGLGTSGILYLAGQDGTILSEPAGNESAFLTARADLSRVPAGKLSTFTDFRGHRVIGTSVGVPQKPWTLVATEDETEALAPVQNLMTTMIILIANLVIAEGAIAWYIAKNIAEAEETRADSEQKLADIINFLPDATFAINRDGIVIAWNRTIEEMTGVAAKDIIGKGDHEYALPFYGERRPVLIDLVFHGNRELMGRYRGVVRSSGKQITAETALPRLKGKNVVLWVTASALYDRHGRIVGGIESIRDITERRRAEEAVQLMNTKLNLLSSITRHDILNQITALQAFLELALEKVHDAVVQDYLTKALGAADTIGRHISFTKSYQDIGVHTPVWQNVSDIVNKTIADYQNIHLACTVELDAIEVFADPLLGKVFYTLIENAVRHGERATEIRFSYRITDNGELVLVAEDNGSGISYGDKDHIFERGYGKHTGFGLFIAREILKITGLSISETGEPGKGARFEITVPGGVFRVEGKPR